MLQVQETLEATALVQGCLPHGPQNDGGFFISKWCMSHMTVIRIGEVSYVKKQDRSWEYSSVARNLPGFILSTTVNK